MDEKTLLRNIYKQKRKNIDCRRREESSFMALQAVEELAKDALFIFSYASFGDEFSTIAINGYLEKEGKLVLPKVEGNTLRLFHVVDSKVQLERSKRGIYEPIASEAQEVDYNAVSLALVPALAFDAIYNRLGYGKGFYDRVLSCFDESMLALGIGFIEQLHDQCLPSGPHDRQLSGTLLF